MKKIKFKKPPLCEDCQENQAIAFSYFGQRNTAQPKKPLQWRFCCICTNDRETYAVEFYRFFRSPESTVDWLAHLHEKPWMDWHDFMEMMHRFRKATMSYNVV